MEQGRESPRTSWSPGVPGAKKRHLWLCLALRSPSTEACKGNSVGREETGLFWGCGSSHGSSLPSSVLCYISCLISSQGQFQMHSWSLGWGSHRAKQRNLEAAAHGGGDRWTSESHFCCTVRLCLHPYCISAEFDVHLPKESSQKVCLS